MKMELYLDGVILYKDRVVVLVSLRSRILNKLYSVQVHQGVASIDNRTQNIVFWPGIVHDIASIRDNCQNCNSPS